MLNYGPFMDLRFLRIINIALVSLIVLSFLILVRELLSPQLKLSSTVLSLQGKKTDGNIRAPVSEKSLNDLELILKNNPFGFPGGELSPLTQRDESMNIEMRLIGTVSGGPDYAIFVMKDGKQEVFKRGEKVFNSGTLERVYSDRVVLYVGGRRRKIPLSDILTIEDIKKEPVHTRLVRSSGVNTFTVNQEGILHALENPAQLMTDARLQPNYVNGRQEGFMLREVREGGIYQSLGLQNGDILLKINNYDITNPEIALQALTALKGMDRVELGIIRNGARMTLNYQIR